MGGYQEFFFENLEYSGWYIGKFLCYFGIFIRVPESDPPKQTLHWHHVYDFNENHRVYPCTCMDYKINSINSIFLKSTKL